MPTSTKPRKAMQRQAGSVYLQPLPEAVLLKVGQITLDCARALRETAAMRPTQAEELLGMCSMLAEVSGRCAKLAPEPAPKAEPSRILMPATACGKSELILPAR